MHQAALEATLGVVVMEPVVVPEVTLVVEIKVTLVVTDLVEVQMMEYTLDYQDQVAFLSGPLQCMRDPGEREPNFYPLVTNSFTRRKRKPY